MYERNTYIIPKLHRNIGRRRSSRFPFNFAVDQIRVSNEKNDNEDAGDESDAGSTNSSHRSANNDLSAKLPDPMSCLALDKVGSRE